MWETAPRENRKISIDERRAMIVEEVNRRSSIQVSDICEQFGVSEVTRAMTSQHWRTVVHFAVRMAALFPSSAPSRLPTPISV